MNSLQTENSFPENKIILRASHLPAGEISVLDMFSGDGFLWQTVKKRTNRKITVTRIDKRPGLEGEYLRGNNLKFLKALNIHDYNVIDLDAFGIPFEQLDFLFKNKYCGHVFVTFIPAVFGQLPHGILYDLGYTDKMINKCPALFNKQGWNKFKNWLAIRGVGKIRHRSCKRKHYIFFEMGY